MKKKIKLSDKQKEVITLMTEGWHLGKWYRFGNTSYWLQENGLGNGGKSLDVNGNTFNSLVENKLISFYDKVHNVSRFKLTELGKTIDIN